MLRLRKRITPAELKEIHARLDAKMCGLTQKWAFEALEVGDFLTLLNIADNEKLGKTKAILYAYRFGYLAGRKEVSACDPVKEEIFEMLKEIKDFDVLIKIFSVTKTHLEILREKEGGASNGCE